MKAHDSQVGVADRRGAYWCLEAAEGAEELAHSCGYSSWREMLRTAREDTLDNGPERAQTGDDYGSTRP